MSREWSFERFDFDAVWEAASRSTAMRTAVESVANQVRQEAERGALRDAYDEGYYHREFDSGVNGGAEIRRTFLQVKGGRRNRRRRGQEGTNRFLEGTAKVVEGDPQGSKYNGAIGWVINSDFKALWIEYGSIAKGPRLILTRAAETVANRIRGNFEKLYGKENAQNLPELSRRISRGKTGR